MAAIRVSNSSVPPNSAVGYLAMRWSDGIWAYGTGALINGSDILTCSHNLIDQVTEPVQGQAQEIFFYPAYNQQRPANPPPFGWEVKAGFYSTNFFNGQDAWDVGLCRLEEELEDPPPFFFTPTVTDEGIINQEVFLTGYPGPRRGEMWSDIDEVAGVHLATNTMVYTNDTWPGNSGSPVWTYDAVEDVARQRGIHVSREPQELRRGVLITNEILEWIQAAVNQPTPVAGGFQLVGI